MKEIDESKSIETRTTYEWTFIDSNNHSNYISMTLVKERERYSISYYIEGYYNDEKMWDDYDGRNIKVAEKEFGVIVRGFRYGIKRMWDYREITNFVNKEVINYRESE